MAYPALLVKSGLFQGSRYILRGPFRIGRHPSNDLQLTDKQVSRFHAIVEGGDSWALLRDLGSRNGTWVNGQRVSEAQLRPGDEIRLGTVRMELLEGVSLEPPSAKEESAVSIAPEALTQVRFRTPAKPGGALSVPPPGPLQEAALQAHLSRLQTLYQANIMLSSEMDLDGVFLRTLEQLLYILPADRGVILQVDPHTDELKVKYSLARTGHAAQSDILVSHAIVRQVLDEGFGVLVDDAQMDRRFQLSESIVEQGVRAALCVPLAHGGETLGMIYLDALGAASAFEEADLQLLTAMAAPAAVQIRNIQYFKKLGQAYVDTLQVLANAIEARDHYTVGHTWRVTRIATAMVEQMDWPAEQRRHAEMGGILHDIGKIAVEDAILRKVGPLTPEEYQKMQLHPEHGARILKDIEFLKPVIPYVLFHQERWDGRGYPFRLKGEDVPQEGRLLAVCDAFDAMTSHRPYRASRPPEEAVKEIWRNREKQFDPAVVDSFVSLWHKGSIAAILQDFAKGEKSIQCPFCSTHIPMGEEPKEGVILECPVCSKESLIHREDGEWKGDLV